MPKAHVDLYYLGYDRKAGRFDHGVGHELRHSIGTRLWGNPGAWDYNFELVYQFGDFANGNIRAWTVASDNHIDLHPSLELDLTKRLTLTPDLDFFWRQSTQDGIYNVAGALIRSGRTSNARYIGRRASAIAKAPDGDRRSVSVGRLSGSGNPYRAPVLGCNI